MLWGESTTLEVSKNVSVLSKLSIVDGSAKSAEQAQKFHKMLVADMKVVSLFDGDKAISQIDMIRYDLYIIDINIPNVNGLEIVKYIRQKDLSTPIIMITASLELDNFKIAFKNGCNEYIKKPFYLEELDIRINNLLSKKDNTFS